MLVNPVYGDRSQVLQPIAEPLVPWPDCARVKETPVLGLDVRNHCHRMLQRERDRFGRTTIPRVVSFMLPPVSLAFIFRARTSATAIVGNLVHGRMNAEQILLVEHRLPDAIPTSTSLVVIAVGVFEMQTCAGAIAEYSVHKAISFAHFRPIAHCHVIEPPDALPGSPSPNGRESVEIVAVTVEIDGLYMKMLVASGNHADAGIVLVSFKEFPTEAEECEIWYAVVLKDHRSVNMFKHPSDATLDALRATHVPFSIIAFDFTWPIYRLKDLFACLPPGNVICATFTRIVKDKKKHCRARLADALKD